VLVALGELTPTEIAGVLGRAVGTVGSQLFRARMALRQLLADAPGREGRDG
jgi:DNA-directed RNA polymerase specialized sigma24 family protein